MDGARAYYAKLNKSVQERQMPYDLTRMWNLRKKTNEHMGRGKRKRREKQAIRLFMIENQLKANGGK